MDPITTASYGLFAAAQRFQASAERTAQGGASADYTTEVVEQIGASHDFKANLQVIRTADEMTGALLDIIS